MKDWKQTALELRAKGLSSRKIATAVGVNKSSVNRYFIRHDRISTPFKAKVKILLLDVETAPLLGFMWGTFKQNIGLNQLEAHSYMLTWAAKWLGDSTCYSASLPDYPIYEPGSEDDSLLVADLLALMNEADIIIGHNVKNFDDKVIRTRILINNLDQPTPYKLVDTLEIAKQNFRFTSNKLDGIAIQLGLQRKANTGGFELWRGCMQGKPEAWQHMLNYNIQDVYVLEDVYLKIRAWDARHPNVALYEQNDEINCTVCGSPNLFPVEKYNYTGVSVFTTFCCSDCGKHVRGRTSVKTKDQKQNIVMNIAR